MKIRLSAQRVIQRVIDSGVNSGVIKAWKTNDDAGTVEIDLTVTLTAAQLTAIESKTGTKVTVLEA